MTTWTRILAYSLALASPISAAETAPPSTTGPPATGDQVAPPPVAKAAAPEAVVEGSGPPAVAEASASPVSPSHVQACVSAEVASTGATRQPHHWDPRSGYGLCPEICGQGEACVDGRCLVRCIPDCRAGAYCTANSECLPIPRVGTPRPTEEELQRRQGAKSANATNAVLVDVGGAFFMGARPTYEWGARHSYHARLLLMNAGLMPYFLETQSAVERFEWGFGASFGYRRYEARWGNLRGFYWGTGLDYAVTEVRDPFENLVASVTHYVSGYGEFGYRWVFGDFLFSFGPALAVKVPVWMHRRALPGGGSCLALGTCPRDANARVEGTMVVEVGWLE